MAIFDQAFNQNQDPNLVWDLEEFENHKRAASFVRQFQDTLCVYSGGVEQLYTNYDVSLPQDLEKNLIILPNPYAFHDTFNRVNPEAVRPTKFVIMPGELAGGKGLHIRIPFTNRKARTVPLASGLRALMRAYENGGHAYHTTLPTDGLYQFRNTIRETEAEGLDKVRELQWDLGARVRALLAEHGFNSVAAEGFEAPGVVVCHTDDDQLKSGQAFIAQGLQTAGGVPLMCDEPDTFKTFRIGLFGLEKWNGIENAVQNLERALKGIN